MSCRSCFDATRDRWACQRERLADLCQHDDQSCTYNGVPLCRPCYDAYRAWHDEQERLADAVRDACQACAEQRRDRAARDQLTDTIDPGQEWGQHIALTCEAHPDLRWHTKNIGCIGARTIFFADYGRKDECDCSVRLLRVVPVPPAFDAEGYPLDPA